MHKILARVRVIIVYKQLHESNKNSIKFSLSTWTMSWLGKIAKLLFISFSFSFFFLFGLTTQGRSVGKYHMSGVT